MNKLIEEILADYAALVDGFYPVQGSSGFLITTAVSHISALEMQKRLKEYRAMTLDAALTAAANPDELADKVKGMSGSEVIESLCRTGVLAKT
jgi:hypothetical protein